MNKVIKDGKEVVGVGRVYLTYHGDGNVGIGTPPQVASAPMGEPVEHLRVSLTDGAIWNKAIETEREKVATWMTRQGYATGHGDSIEDLLKELEWQIRESEREACAKVVEDYCGAWDDKGYALASAIRARGNT